MIDPTLRQADFPSLSEMTYLNTAAEGIPPRAVGQALEAYWRDKQRGMKGREGHFAAVEACREVSARMLGLAPDEVSFCSCSSEAYNLLAGALDLGPTDEVVVSDLDFPAGSTPWLRSPRPPGVRLWRSRAGELHLEDLAPLLGPATRLVQVSLVSFYNGHRVDFAPLRARVREQAPAAALSVDITQALGRVELDCSGADVLISSTHKWTLGVHGGGIVGIPRASAERLTTRAGGWYHLRNAFAPDRFARAEAKPGAASFSVGMPSFPALYALNAGLRYVDGIGVARIAAQADPLVAAVDAGLRRLGIAPLSPSVAGRRSGIVAFQHPKGEAIHAALLKEGIQVMHQAGRLRVSVHGYNTRGDVDRFLNVLSPWHLP